MGYFENTYRRVNDLSPQGRRNHWRYLDLTIGRWLPPPAQRPRILDIGCGAGIVLEWLAARGYADCRGIDADPGQVEFARGLGCRVDLDEDGAAWLERNGPVDFIILKDVLEHLPQDTAEHLLRAMARGLAPAGRAYISVPNANSAFAGRWRYIDATHLRSYTEPSLVATLSAAGLAAERIIDDDVWASNSLLGHGQQALKRVFRACRRAEACAEFGRDGWSLRLGLNLVAVVQPGAA